MRQPTAAAELQWPFNGKSMRPRTASSEGGGTQLQPHPAGAPRGSAGGGSYVALLEAAHAPAPRPVRGGIGKGWAAAVQGRYDPLRHEWIAPPAGDDPDTARAKQRDAARHHGLIGIRCPKKELPAPAPAPDAGAGAAADAPECRSPTKRAPTPEIKLAAPKERAAPAEIVASPARNPITGAGVDAPAPKPAGAEAAAKPGMRWCVQPCPQAGHEPDSAPPNACLARPAPAAPHPSPSAPPNQPPRGKYDPFTHECKVAPSDPRYLHEAQEQEATRANKGVRRVEPAPRRGVYDPIRADWVVPPSGRRASSVSADGAAAVAAAEALGLRSGSAGGAGAGGSSGGGATPSSCGAAPWQQRPFGNIFF
jgi:hypothetical protein